MFPLSDLFWDYWELDYWDSSLLLANQSLSQVIQSQNLLLSI